MTIGERVKRIRKELGLTQAQFGKRVSITFQAISLIEKGISNPSDQTINLICREFHVRDEWLRTGEGPMLEEKPRDEALASELDKILTAGDNDFRRKMISLLVQMPPDWWRVLEDKAREILAQPLTPDAAPVSMKTPHSMTREEAHALLDRQFDEEEAARKRVTGEASTSGPGSSGTATG